jgi:hypothetical protein
MSTGLKLLYGFLLSGALGGCLGNEHHSSSPTADEEPKLEITETADSPYPFTPLMEQSYIGRTEAASTESPVAQPLFRAIHVTPDLWETRAGSAGRKFHTSFYDRKNPATATVQYRILGEYPMGVDLGTLTPSGDYTPPRHADKKLEFVVRARLADQPEIYADAMVIVYHAKSPNGLP